MAGIGDYEKGKAFTLKSGNKPSFKEMGSSPAKHMRTFGQTTTQTEIDSVGRHNDAHKSGKYGDDHKNVKTGADDMDKKTNQKTVELLRKEKVADKKSVALQKKKPPTAVHTKEEFKKKKGLKKAAKDAATRASYIIKAQGKAGAATTVKTKKKKGITPEGPREKGVTTRTGY